MKINLQSERIFLLAKTKNHILNSIWPPFCVGCHKDTSNYSKFHHYLCPQCLESIPEWDATKCPICKKRNIGDYTLCSECKKNFSLKGIIIASSYKHLVIKEAVKTFKYQGVKSLSLPLASLMVRKLTDFFEKYQGRQLAPSYLDWVLIPVPATNKKTKKRGFNQAELLSVHIQKAFDIPLKTDIIKKCHNTYPQMSLKDAEKRKNNLKGVFTLNPKINKKMLRGRKVLLVDDVTTTGTTLEECAKILAPICHEVWCAVIAK